MNDTALVILTALCSGLVATFVTIWWQSKSQQKEEKLRIFTVLMSKRYDISSQESVEALNMIDVIFYSSAKVRSAWKDFNDATNAPDSTAKPQNITDKHLRLLEVMAENIGYKEIRWEDIKHYYYPVGLSEKRQQEEALRRVQIDAGLAQIQGAREQEKNGQIDKNTELAGQILLEGMRNPESLGRLLELADKTQSLNKSGKKQK